MTHDKYPRQESLSTNPEEIAEQYPTIGVLNDALSYTRADTTLYPDKSGEELRTIKSIATRRLVTAGNEAELLGSNADALQPGYKIYKHIIEDGITELGEGDAQLGAERMDSVLAVHDLAKSQAVGRAAHEKLGVTDHDLALTALVADNFDALDGNIEPETVSWLKTTLQPTLHFAHFLVKSEVSIRHLTWADICKERQTLCYSAVPSTMPAKRRWPSSY